MKKKVCMIVPSFTAKGGITAVVNGYKDSRLEEDFDLQYIEAYCDGNKLKKVFWEIKGYIIFVVTLLIWHPEIVHVHSSFAGSFYRKLPFIKLARLFHKPIINHIHGADFDAFYRNASQRKKNIIRKCYDACSVLVALSDEWKENLSEIVNPEKIAVVENYSILNYCAIEERRTKENTKTVLFLGFIGHRKGCYDIPAIVQKVIKEIPDAKFILAGSGEIERIKNIAAEKVNGALIFPGWIRGNEKDALLRQADMFFLPSYNEGMPMSILDAMGYGLPVVSTTVGGITKIVHDQENGFVFQPGDICGMANAIIRILKNDSLREKMGESSVSIVEEKYSLDRHIDTLEKIYHQVERK